MSRLQGQVAVVIGASSGIGRATALQLGQEGAHVLLAGRSQARLEDLAQVLVQDGCQALWRVMDARREADVADLLNLALQRWGRLDLLVNSAGVGYPGSVAGGVAEHWREMLETNVLGLALACREAIRVMGARGGTLVNVSSLAALRPTPGDAFYGATKHAVKGFSDALRLENAGTPIRVIAVEPGQVMTSFARNVPHQTLVERGRSLGLSPGEIPDFHGGHAPDDFIELVLNCLPEQFLAAEEVARRLVDAVCRPEEHGDRVLVLSQAESELRAKLEG